LKDKKQAQQGRELQGKKLESLKSLSPHYPNKKR